MDDLISRGDAIKAVLVSNLSACTVFGRSKEGMATAKELIQVIKNLPSVQPEIPSYVTEIESEYKKWVSMSYINKPLAKALYEVWKKHDREDVSRNG